MRTFLSWLLVPSILGLALHSRSACAERDRYQEALQKYQNKQYADALPLLKQAVELDPENLMARFMLARTYVFSYHELQIPNFVELTLEQLNYIVKKDPSFPAAHHHLALVYINGGEPGKALEELNTELRFYPENTQARLELGET